MGFNPERLKMFVGLATDLKTQTAVILITLTVLIVAYAWTIVKELDPDKGPVFSPGRLPRLMSGVAILTLMFVAGATVYSPGGFFGSEPAAWAQAGGSIEALLMAVYIGQMGVEAEERRRRKAVGDFIEAITTSVDMALNEARALRDAIKDRELVRLKDEVASLDHGASEPLHLILAAPIDRWPSVVLFTRVRSVQWHLQTLLDQIRMNLPGAHVPENRFFERHFKLESALHTAEDAYRQSVAGVKMD